MTSQGINKVIWILPLGTMSISTKCHDNPNCQDISLKPKYVNLMVVPEETLGITRFSWLHPLETLYNI